MREIDLAVFRAINNAPDWLEPPMIFFSEGNKWWWVRIGLLAVLVFFAWRKNTRKATVLAMVSWPIANAACDALKFGMRLPRPSVDLADAIVRVERLTSFGTASEPSSRPQPQNLFGSSTEAASPRRTFRPFWPCHMSMGD